MKAIIAVFVALFIIVMGLGIYLAPNDLAGCENTPSEAKQCRRADAIVAISGGDTAARAREAVALYKNDWGEKLIFSGAALDKSGPSNAAAMRRDALNAGVPDDDIIIEEYSETTKQNAEKTQAILEKNDISSVILVTSAYHQRRAGLEFAKRAGGSVALRNHPVAQDNQWSRIWWLTPGGWYLAVSEFVKVIAFYVGGTR
jgi:uncharacterized SAM-binding protein YcdF (DUF218 family)